MIANRWALEIRKEKILGAKEINANEVITAKSMPGREKSVQERENKNTIKANLSNIFRRNSPKDIIERLFVLIKLSADKANGNSNRK